MTKKVIRKWFYLGVLFLLPVIFLLFLYPSTHNYNPLDIVKTNVNDVEEFSFLDDNKSLLNENITVLSFLGSDPMGNITSVLNLKELIYDKFKGFKKFQIITISTMGTELILQFFIIIEFSILDIEIVVLSPTLTFGPIEEPEDI